MSTSTFLCVFLCRSESQHLSRHARSSSLLQKPRPFPESTFFRVCSKHFSGLFLYFTCKYYQTKGISLATPKFNQIEFISKKKKLFTGTNSFENFFREWLRIIRAESHTHTHTLYSSTSFYILIQFHPPSDFCYLYLNFFLRPPHLTTNFCNEFSVIFFFCCTLIRDCPFRRRPFKRRKAQDFFSFVFFFSTRYYI